MACGLIDTKSLTKPMLTCRHAVYMHQPFVELNAVCSIFSKILLSVFLVLYIRDICRERDFHQDYMLYMWIYIVGYLSHCDVIKWKHFPRYWPFVRGIHLSPVDSPHKGPVTRTSDVPLLSVWTNGWTNSRLVGNSRRHDGNLTSP